MYRGNNGNLDSAGAYDTGGNGRDGLNDPEQPNWYQSAFQQNNFQTAGLAAAAAHQHQQNLAHQPVNPHQGDNDDEDAYGDEDEVHVDVVDDDDDDLLLKSRLQQVIQEHKHGSTHNVLRELADVAENHHHTGMPSQPVAANRKRSRQLPLRARRVMDELIQQKQNVRKGLHALEEERDKVQKTVDSQIADLERINQNIWETAERLCDELLQERTSWNLMYSNLVGFFKEKGHVRVPWKKEDKEISPALAKLGPWLVHQRKEYRRPMHDPDRLEPYKIIALERLKIEWEPYKIHWMKRLDELKEYKEKHGHCRVPYCTGKGKRKREGGADTEEKNGEEKTGNGESGKYDSLGVWVKRQRYQYKMFQQGIKEKSAEMSDEKIKMLEEIGFEWSLRKDVDIQENWYQRFDEIKQFKADHGHCRVDEKENKALHDWLKLVRQTINKYEENPNESGITPDQYKLLKDLDLDSKLRDTKFEQRIADFKEFVQHHGHGVVPSNYPHNVKLRNWVQTQNRQYKLWKEGKKSQLNDEKVAFLKSIGFEFEVSKERKSETLKNLTKSWDEVYAELVQYKEKFGSIVQIKQRKHKALREWCDEQRVQAERLKWGKRSTITEEQIQRLASIGFEWCDFDAPSKGWDDYFSELCLYYLKHRTFEVPEGIGDLKEWVNQQRMQYRKFINSVPSFLTSIQIRKLNRVGFPWNVRGGDGKEASEQSWEEMFGELLFFKIKHGHLFVDSQSNPDLYDWMVKQRVMKARKKSTGTQRRSAITDERNRKLDEIGFNWDGPQNSAAQLARRPKPNLLINQNQIPVTMPIPYGGMAFSGREVIPAYIVPLQTAKDVAQRQRQQQQGVIGTAIHAGSVQPSARNLNAKPQAALVVQNLAASSSAAAAAAAMSIAGNEMQKSSTTQSMAAMPAAAATTGTKPITNPKPPTPRKIAETTGSAPKPTAAGKKTTGLPKQP